MQSICNVIYMYTQHDTFRRIRDKFVLKEGKFSAISGDAIEENSRRTKHKNSSLNTSTSPKHWVKMTIRRQQWIFMIICLLCTSFHVLSAKDMDMPGHVSNFRNSYCFLYFRHLCLPKGRHSEGPHEIHLICAQN